MEYENQARSAIGGAGQGMTAAQIEKPRIAQQLDQLYKVLGDCHENTTSLEHAAERILGPVPQDPSKDSPKPPVSTIEQRFAEAIGVAEVLAHRLRNASQRFNSAV